MTLGEPTCFECDGDDSDVEMVRDENGKFQKECSNCGYRSDWGDSDPEDGQASLEEF